MKRIGWLGVVLVLAVGACGRHSQHEEAVNDLVSDAHDVVLPNVRAAIARGKPEDAIPCTRVTANLHEIERDGGHEDVVAEIKQVCQHDINLAHMKRAVEEAEAAVKARPDEKVRRECFSAEYDMAVQRLNEARLFDAPAEKLQARFVSACPLT